MQEKNFGKSQHTHKLDKIILTSFSKYVNKTFMEVKKEDVVAFFNAMKSGELHSKRGKYGDYTIELYKSQIKKFYKWLYNYEETQSVPKQVSWITVNAKRAYKHKTEADILTVEEVEALIEAAKTPRNRAIISVLFDSAARIGEFVNLKMKDVIVKDGDVSLCVDGKTGPRKIPLNISTKYLLEYLEEHPFRELRDSPLWISKRKQKLTVSGFQNQISKIRKRANITKKLTPHIFRHSRLTDLARKGMNESSMRCFAGWSQDSSMPAVYLHLCGDDVKNALRKIEPKVTYVEKESLEKQVQQRLTEEKKNMQDEILKRLLDLLKNPQHKTIQDFLFEESEKA